MELDHVNAKRKKYGYSIPHASFNASLYRQPSLNEGEQQPEPYRTAAASQVHQQAAAARRSSIKAEVTEQLGAMESGQGRPIPKSTPGVSPPFRPPTIVETDLEEEDNRDLEETIEEFLGEGSHGYTSDFYMNSLITLSNHSLFRTACHSPSNHRHVLERPGMPPMTGLTLYRLRKVKSLLSW